jgi:hypothetical protein
MGNEVTKGWCDPEATQGMESSANSYNMVWTTPNSQPYPNTPLHFSLDAYSNAADYMATRKVIPFQTSYAYPYDCLVLQPTYQSREEFLRDYRERLRTGSVNNASHSLPPRPPDRIESRVSASKVGTMHPQCPD